MVRAGCYLPSGHISDPYQNTVRSFLTQFQRVYEVVGRRAVRETEAAVAITLETKRPVGDPRSCSYLACVRISSLSVSGLSFSLKSRLAVAKAAS